MDATGIPLLKVARPASVDKLLNSTREIRPITIKSRQKPASLVIKRMETKLMQALEKKEKAEKLLATLEESVETSGVESDKETITKEERYMLRKVGLRMKPFLLLGRRGVFDGTVENMHLHWKYRELVKIISKDWSIERVESAARMLEAESGGILVAVERVNKGHAIIIYRGKNYRRPSDLRPKTLLNKKEAMKRSLEAQRCASLKLHVLSLSRNIDHLRDQMAKEQAVEDEMQLTESDKLDIDDERIEHSWSVERDHVSAGSSHEQQSTEEVNEAAEEYLHLNKSDCVLNEEESSTVTSNNAINSIFSLNHSQENWLALKHVDQFSKNENVRFDSESTTSTNMSNKEKGCSSNEPGFYPESCAHQEEVPIPAISNGDEDEAELSIGSAGGTLDKHVHEYKLRDDSDLEIPFRAAPLSNRERLVLRKQALKMRKRPVLAVGRSNIVTGVAKTIKTHFKKHPLAIVNIKGRAEGTSVQEVIFQLEQATGAVLVSREPNKVILYRGWGEGETAGGDLKNNDEGKGTNVKEEKVSAKLMEAMRVECGLSVNTVE